MRGGGSTGSSQCRSASQGMHISLLPTMASIASDEDVFAQFKEESWKQYVRMWYQFIWEFRVTYTKHKSVWCVRSNTAKDVFREMGIPRLTITQASGLAHDKHTQVTRYNETTKDRGIQSKLAANELVF